MKHISKEEFLNQDEKVQREFKDYFECETMLFYSNNQLIYGEFNDILINTPAVTEGQLRKFIEDKTRYKVEAPWHGCYDIYLVDQLTGQEVIKDYFNLDTDLLQAYWKVACEIASNGGEF